MHKAQRGALPRRLTGDYALALGEDAESLGPVVRVRSPRAGGTIGPLRSKLHATDRRETPDSVTKSGLFLKDEPNGTCPDITSSTDSRPLEDAGQSIDAPGLNYSVFALFFILGGITSLNDVILPKL